MFNVDGYLIEERRRYYITVCRFNYNLSHLPVTVVMGPKSLLVYISHALLYLNRQHCDHSRGGYWRSTHIYLAGSCSRFRISAPVSYRTTFNKI